MDSRARISKEKRGAAMATSDDVVREVLSDLDGILMLNAWEATLLRNVREKTAALAGGSAGGPAPSKPEPSGTDPDCVGDGGDSAV